MSVVSNIRLLLFSVILITSFAVGAQGAIGQELTFPTLKAEDLNGKALTLPKDLPGNPTLVLIAFIRKQQGDIDLWIKELKLKDKETAITWIELPYIGSQGRLFKPIIDKGMRKGITSEEARAKTISVYEEHDLLLDGLKLKGVDQIYVAVVEPGGKVRAVVAGPPTEKTKQSIVGALSLGG